MHTHQHIRTTRPGFMMLCGSKARLMVRINSIATVDFFSVNLTTFKEDELLFSDDQRKTLDKLHYKVMPFIMRRMKSDVLKELPEKIINDYYCTLS